MERLALTHPQCSFELYSDDRTILKLRPQTAKERVRSLLASGEDYPILEFPIDAGLIQGTLYWVQGLSLPSTKQLIQVVNGRALRDRLLQQAALQPFRQALLPGQFPALALFLSIDPSLLDVNVHPTKTEVRFLESGRIFREISSSAERMISENGAPAFASGLSLSIDQTPVATPLAFSFPPRSTQVYVPIDVDTPARSHLTLTEPTSNESAPWVSKIPFSLHQYVGVLFQTYLAFDESSELVLIDQHAAHERVRYEKLRKRYLNRHSGIERSQVLLLPESAPFPVERRKEIEARIPILEGMGFDAELFGEDQILFRSIPLDWGVHDLRLRLKSLLERILEVQETSRPQELIDETVFEKLASEACHSSVRAGDRLERIEAITLVEQLFDCEHPWNCPHGRPTVARIPRARFEEWFKRLV
jgi:DNA mismatch repair protein MutL